MQGAKLHLEKALLAASKDGCGVTDSELAEHHFKLGRILWTMGGAMRESPAQAREHFEAASMEESDVQVRWSPLRVRRCRRPGLLWWLAGCRARLWGGAGGRQLWCPDMLPQGLRRDCALHRPRPAPGWTAYARRQIRAAAQQLCVPGHAKDGPTPNLMAALLIQ